jgi:NADH-quinone oxidoreductase subunit K
MIVLNIFKIVCLILFFISFYGIIFNRKNLILTLIFLELCFLSINILLVLISFIYGDIFSQLILIYILTLTAIETAVGLALFIVYFKMFKTVELIDLSYEL